MYVFLDIDGTLISEVTQEFPESAQRACTTAQANGHKLLLCTGRVHQEVYPWLWDFPWDGAITASGGCAELDGKRYVSEYIDPELVNRLVNFMHEHHVDYSLLGDEFIVPNTGYFGHIAEVASRWKGALPDLLNLDGPFFARFSTPRDDVIPDVRKVVFLGGGEITIDDVRAAFGRRLSIVESSVTVFGSGGGDIMMQGVNKGAAIVQLMDALNVPMSETVGIGDSMNDREMMDVCGTSVAMGNGLPEIKRAADFVTTSISDDGIANAFKMLGLLAVPERR